jgi:hypothetical protein
MGILPGDAQDELWGDLVVSILSVNNWSLESAYAGLPGLQSGGLCSPENLVKWDVEEIVAGLKNAGFDRGPFMTTLFARRLASLGVAVGTMGVEDFSRSLSSKQRTKVSNLLMPINGIGPRVLANFFLLRQI